MIPFYECLILVEKPSIPVLCNVGTKLPTTCLQGKMNIVIPIDAIMYRSNVPVEATFGYLLSNLDPSRDVWGNSCKCHGVSQIPTLCDQINFNL